MKATIEDEHRSRDLETAFQILGKSKQPMKLATAAEAKRYKACGVSLDGGTPVSSLSPKQSATE
jgi:hypothetical protein